MLLVSFSCVMGDPLIVAELMVIEIILTLSLKIQVDANDLKRVGRNMSQLELYFGLTLKQRKSKVTILVESGRKQLQPEKLRSTT
jgi:hypothetical protein